MIKGFYVHICTYKIDSREESTFPIIVVSLGDNIHRIPLMRKDEKEMRTQTEIGMSDVFWCLFDSTDTVH